jgi:hypothetical protein
MRVQIPTYSDWWMKGDRFGEVIKITSKRPDNLEVAHVKLDKSGKIIRVIRAHCTEI